MTSPPATKILRQKLTFVVCLVIPTSLSVYILVETASGWHFSTSTARWVEENRPMIGTVVQVVSMVLGALQIYALSSVLTMSFHIRMLSTTTSLNELKFWNALSQGRLDWDLPYKTMAILTAYVVAIQIPSALWAGAFTPVSTTANVAAEFSIPQYSQSVAQLTMDVGTFTYVAWKYKTGLLLNSINQASARNSSIPQIRKLDNTGYVYHGRSYGVAAAIGLRPINQTSPTKGAENADITSYTYHESGYISNVECIYNVSSALRLDRLTTWDNSNSNIGAGGYWVNGSLPNGDWTGFPTWAGFDNGTVFALGASNGGCRHIYGFIGGSYYDFFNNIQCEVTFTPDTFEVAANMAAKIITVTPTGKNTSSSVGAGVPGQLQDLAFFYPSYMSQVLTTGYTSVLEKAFEANIDNVRAREGHANATMSDTLTGVSEALESLIDHSFGSIGAAQLMLVDDAQTVKANATINTVKLSEPKYTYSIFGISMAILILLIFEAVRSRFWSALGIFNSLDLKSAILGVVATRGDKPELLKKWNGDAADRDVGNEYKYGAFA
ncbi:hypothetical protein NKR23_g11961 [Pleurostoma richardsiae]|uniref:Uncharacterized protein n=1 Tax=Pleurostoma richardsiae TaxID=41990 RepID=A0AA38VG73_9PEZI|nr:hypothetical protein NKR23_g11961 [Pleurostoma richardsiae]